MAKWIVPDEVKLASVWIVWGFLGLGSLGWGLFVLLDYFKVLSDAAAWVQAVGSVVAILVAVWVSHREVRLQADGRLLDSYNYMHKTLSVAAYGEQAVVDAADYLLSASFTAHMLEFHEHLLGIAVQDLEEIEYASIDSMTVATAFLSIKRAAAHTKASLTLVRQTGGNFTIPQLIGWKTNVNSGLQDLESGLSEYLVANPRLVDLVL